MLPSTLDDLLRIFDPSLEKQQNHFRQPLPTALRLAVALQHLTAGESQTSLFYNFRMGRSILCQILNEDPEKILEILSRFSVPVPGTTDNWKKLADDFWNLCGFPLCLCTIDGKHCVIIT